MFVNDEEMDRCAFGAIGYRQTADGFHETLMHDFEFLILVVCRQTDESPRVEHFENGLVRYQIIYITSSDLRRWIVLGENSDILKCFLEGDIIWDQREELKQLRGQIVDFEQSVRAKRKFKEFAKFLKHYLEAKRLHQSRLFLDGYTAVIRALQHLGHLEVLDRGMRSEDGIWEQLHSLNTPAYKLYEEMSSSAETLEQRLELALLAFEFSATSMMSDCCLPLLHILRSRKEPWSLQELMHKGELHELKEELPLVLRMLVYRSLVKQTTASKLKEASGQGILYWA
nr:nucleotidyltransferase-like protein [Paenibacillus caui]